MLPGLTLVAVGSGLGYAPMFALATGVPEQFTGAASGLVTTVQELGAAMGLATLTALGLWLAGGELGAATFAVAAVASALATAFALVPATSEQELVEA